MTPTWRLFSVSAGDSSGLKSSGNDPLPAVWEDSCQAGVATFAPGRSGRGLCGRGLYGRHSGGAIGVTGKMLVGGDALGDMKRYGSGEVVTRERPVAGVLTAT